MTLHDTWQTWVFILYGYLWADILLKWLWVVGIFLRTNWFWRRTVVRLIIANFGLRQKETSFIWSTTSHYSHLGLRQKGTDLSRVLWEFFVFFALDERLWSCLLIMAVHTGSLSLVWNADHIFSFVFWMLLLLLLFSLLLLLLSRAIFHASLLSCECPVSSFASTIGVCTYYIATGFWHGLYS